MPSDNAGAPSPHDVAVRLMVPVFNSALPVRVLDRELRAAAERKKLREGFKRPVVEHLRGNGFEVEEVPGGMVITPPKERTPSPISFSEAEERSKEAIESGRRSVDVSDELVINEDGSAYLDPHK